jgi:hypothetical protein
MAGDVLVGESEMAMVVGFMMMGGLVLFKLERFV